jgi:histidine ammonia-lyase
VHSSVVLKQFDWQPIVLQSKEGFTERNTIYECLWTHILMKVNKFSYLADLIGTISLEALMSYRTFP